MFENDSIHAFRRSTPKRSKQPGMTSAQKQDKDDFIMDTNNSSIVSKRSVEKLYYAGEPEYFRHFVSKFKRRSPLINRGYWLRMRAVEHTVERFLKEPSGKRKVVINLGCGYDPLPWLFLGKQKDLCINAFFVDVDYPQLMKKKVEMIQKTTQLNELLPNLTESAVGEGVLCRSDRYAAVGCDLRNLAMLSAILQQQLDIESNSVAILFTAEVSTAYMDLEGSQAVFEWASTYEDVRFCLLEQHLPDGPDHPFAQTMLKHFEKLRTPLTAIGTIDEMRRRFARAGWPLGNIDIRSLWSLWSDSKFLTAEQRMALDTVEPFDEWEEFALFASHYFLLVARKGGSRKQGHANDDRQSSTSNATIPAGASLFCNDVPQSAHSYRRFAAVIPPLDDGSACGLHAGLGSRTRLSSTDTYATRPTTAEIRGPPLQWGLMCHTITRFDSSGDCLLVGGRTSPDKARAECWLRREGRWSRAQDLPAGRYRHCAVAMADDDGESSVMVYGGKMRNGQMADDVLIWTEKRSWRKLKCSKAIPAARFGAVMIPDGHRSGLLLGGMTIDGTIAQSGWKWAWDGKDKIVFEDVSVELKRRFPNNTGCLWRFGGRSEHWKTEAGSIDTVILGGIRGDGMLTRQDEVINLSKDCTHVLRGARPLLAGFELRGRLCLGGGATCFSFGTYWNSTSCLRLENEADPIPEWYLAARELEYGQQSGSEIMTSSYHDFTGGALPEQRSVERMRLDEAGQFERVLACGQPVVFEGCYLGSCTSKWTPDYLKTTVGEQRKVVVHESSNSKMDFQTKNFRYETREFGKFVEEVEQGGLLYLRALSKDAPSDRATCLADDFPEIAGDFTLPPELLYAMANAHSSPLRMSGPVTMWLHYDVMANVLCQIRGTKRLLLFPPSDVAHLGFEAGASSSSIDVFNASSPTLKHCHPREALLKPGDVLFIPALWLHTAAPTEAMSVAVNVFFRHLNSGVYAAGRDVYGNRDLAAYERGRKEISKVVQSFADVPSEMSRFYLERLGMELLGKARVS